MATVSARHEPRTRRTGSTALHGARHRHPIGDALRALRVFVSAAFRVVVLGEYAGHERGAGRN